MNSVSCDFTCNSIERQEEESRTIKFINGFRSLFHLWILLLHYFTSVISMNLQTEQISSTFKKENNLITKIIFYFIKNAIFSVDGFFILSGLLGMNSFIHHLNQRKINKTSLKKILISFYWNRFVRIAPLYYLVIVIGYLGQFDLQKKRGGTMEHFSFIQSFLFIENFKRFDYLIYPVTWSICVDFQCYLLIPFIYFIYFKVKKVFKINNFKVVVGFIVASAFLSSLLRLEQILFNNSMNQMKFVKLPKPFYIWQKIAMDSASQLEEILKTQLFFINLYSKTTTRFFPFTLGIGLSFILNENNLNRLRRYQIILFMLSFALFCLPCLSEPWEELCINNEGKLWGILSSVFYLTFMHVIFSISIFGFILCFFIEKGFVLFEKLKNVLSLKVFQIISKLSYSNYLFHFLLFYFEAVTLKELFGSLTIESLIMNNPTLCLTIGYLINVTLSLILSYFPHTYIELPCMKKFKL
ncbi:hypothetical protein ABK040_009767 [Willaertia magna]